MHKIQPGMFLARPIPMPNDPYRFLLQRDREIPLDLVPRLKQLGLLEVWVRHRGLEFLEDIIDEDLGEHQREIYIGVRENFESLMRDITAKMDFTHFQNSISSFFSYLRSSSGSNILLQKLDAFDNYLMSHSANISYLAMLVGMNVDRYLIDERRFKSAREAKELHLLGLGCLLHDVGKIQVPKEILNKPGRLTDEEMDVIRQHTTYGYEMVKGRIPATAAQIVLNHHQRWDGKG
ncbi:MAG: HD domain-containing protein, partial [Planctomycetota bacterium]|nr:HD domain-containing protein [Planctomycetota bacterium]